MIVAYLSVAAGGFAQSSVGFGLGLVSVSFLVAAIGHAPAVATVLALSLLANVLVVTSERHGLDVRAALGLFAPSAATQLALFTLVRRVDPEALVIATGGTVIAAAIVMGSGVRVRALHGTGGLLAAGALSGLMNLVAGLGGPASVLYATNAGWEPTRWRPTMNLYFAMSNCVTLALLRVAPPTDAWLYAAALLGALLGARAARRLPHAQVRIAALTLAAVGGVLAILGAVGS